MATGQDTILGTDIVRDALKTKVNDDMAELHLIKAEVVAARDGLTNLLAQIDSLQTSILAVTAANGSLVSANDSTPGFLNGKLLGTTDEITLTEGSDGGNETLSLSLVSSGRNQDLDAIVFFNSIAF